MGNLEVQARRYLAGEIDFNSYARSTRVDYERMAQYLERRWTTGVWYAREDTIQELLTSTWLRIWKWDETRATLGAYLMFSILTDAVYPMHKARGASLGGTRGKNPSRIEWPVSSKIKRRTGAEEETFDEAIGRMLRKHGEDAESPEDQAIRTEARRGRIAMVLGKCRVPIERAVIRAMAEAEDVDGAGEVLYQMDPSITPDAKVMTAFAVEVASNVMARVG